MALTLPHDFTRSKPLIGLSELARLSGANWAMCGKLMALWGGLIPPDISALWCKAEQQKTKVQE